MYPFSLKSLCMLRSCVSVSMPPAPAHFLQDPACKAGSFLVYHTFPDMLLQCLTVSLIVLAGLRASFTSQHSHHGTDLRSTVSPDRHIGPIYEDRAFHGPLYRSPSHITHSPLYRSPSGQKLYTYKQYILYYRELLQLPSKWKQIKLKAALFAPKRCRIRPKKWHCDIFRPFHDTDIYHNIHFARKRMFRDKGACRTCRLRPGGAHKVLCTQ